jgi:GNAT superfamily N-acetyltransferase
MGGGQAAKLLECGGHKERVRAMIIHTQLNDGIPVCIRRVRKGDEARLKDGIAQLSPQSRYLRFFSGMREAPPQVIKALITVDGHDHIAWGALRSDLPDTPALGVVHAFRDKEHPEVAEFSVAVIDEYHGRGLARLLSAVLLLDCQQEGLEHLSVRERGRKRAYPNSTSPSPMRSNRCEQRRMCRGWRRSLTALLKARRSRDCDLAARRASG